MFKLLRSYIFWAYERGSVHYDVMVTAILLFMFVSPHFINYNDKPVETVPLCTPAKCSSERPAPPERQQPLHVPGSRRRHGRRNDRRRTPAPPFCGSSNRSPARSRWSATNPSTTRRTRSSPTTPGCSANTWPREQHPTFGSTSDLDPYDRDLPYDRNLRIAASLLFSAVAPMTTPALARAAEARPSRRGSASDGRGQPEVPVRRGRLPLGSLRARRQADDHPDRHDLLQEDRERPP